MQEVQTCRDLMQPDCSFVKADETVLAAARLMEANDIGFLPVCNAEKKLMGALTDRDIVTRVVAQDVDLRCKVGSIASTMLVSCVVSTPIRKALELMQDNRVQRIICTNEDETLAGVITTADLVRYADQREVGERVGEVKQPAAH